MRKATPVPFDPRKILSEDDHFVAVHKEAGELVVADRFGLEKSVLLHDLGEHLRSAGHKPDATGRDLYPVHRLDRDTSGVVLFAKHEEAHRALSRMFEGREMHKTYWAFVVGAPAWSWCRCEIPLSRAEGKKGRGRALVDLARGKPAETDFLVKEIFGDVSWIEARPRTGRLHQIRVHLRSLGHPLLVDHQYGLEDWRSASFPGMELTRMPLHARSLSFTHPFTKNPVDLNAPLGGELRALLDRLKKRGDDLAGLPE
ncbi:MAG: RluA family pseudouridine synthase [Bdellovibrionales bacterium]|nr:RluA family pseudouridine synthase [Bdellovibrionales bacterium]